MGQSIYADYNGSAPICEEVRKFLINRITQGPYANPNSIHALGGKVLMQMEKARGVAARVLGASSAQIVFNSGATEGISQAFHSVLSKETRKKLIVLSGIEHSAVINNAKYYTGLGFELLVPKTLPSGIVDIQDLEKIVNSNAEQIALVAIMGANNETGVIQPYLEIGNLCSAKKIPYLCDTTQLIGKIPFHFKNSPIDFAVMSGHKIGAMTGVGILLVKNPQQCLPLVIGGGQENGLRGGTQNYIGNETIAVALLEMEKNFQHLSALNQNKLRFEAKIKKLFPQVVILGGEAERVANTTFISYPGIHGQAVQIELESQNIFVSTSSACSDNEPTTSKVLKAMGVTDDLGRGAVRISLGFDHYEENYQILAGALEKAYNKLVKIKSF